MQQSGDYRFLREGEWNLWILAQRWNQDLWTEVLRQLRDLEPTKHPRMRQMRCRSGPAAADLYLKIYFAQDFFTSVKDLFRDSKALRSLKQSDAMKREGFAVPLAIAAGEERRYRLLKRSFLLTEAVDGSSIPGFLQQHYCGSLDPRALRKKRDYLGQLAGEIRRLHQCGFVHGDLVPFNILVRLNDDKDEVTFFYLDNDRTRRYPKWLRHNLWRRNLVQLNRFVLPGISLQDRMRFLRWYLGKREWGEQERRLVRWLEKRTRRRRWQCDRVEAPVSFRELMRWNGPFTNKVR